MTTTTIAPDRQVDRTGTSFELEHYYCCCDPTRGLCGVELGPDEVDCPEDCGHDECVVCVDLRDLECPQCGFDNYGPCACGEFC